MRKIGLLFLLGIAIILLFVIFFLVLELDVARNNKQVIRVFETQEIVESFEYIKAEDMNERLWSIISSDGGYQSLINFFNVYTKNAEVSVALLEEALNQDVAVPWLFGLAWGESSFNPNAKRYNSKSKTWDRGVLALSDGHRKNWPIADFFNIKKNVKEGTTYFKQSLTQYGNNFVLGIAGYNAGIYSITSGIGFLTLQHINNIIQFEGDLEIELNYFINRWKVKDAAK